MGREPSEAGQRLVSIQDQQAPRAAPHLFRKSRPTEGNLRRKPPLMFLEESESCEK